jgi:hypothetical protein
MNSALNTHVSDSEGITYDGFSIKYTCFDTEGITYDGFSIKYTFRYRKKNI